MSTTLNRFPLLGLWAREAARRMGYREDEASALGHAYAVLYAIRLRRLTRLAEVEERAERAQRKVPRDTRQIRLGGDDLTVVQTGGRVRGLVGGETPQTAETYRRSVADKFPDGYYDRLQECFRVYFQSYTPEELREGIVYDHYDQWKRACGVGRLVDLDRLLRWCQRRIGG